MATTNTILTNQFTTVAAAQQLLVYRPCSTPVLTALTSAANNTGSKICQQCTKGAATDATACTGTNAPAAANAQAKRCTINDDFCYALEVDCIAAKTAAKIDGSSTWCPAAGTAKSYIFGCATATLVSVTTVGTVRSCNNTTGV